MILKNNGNNFVNLNIHIGNMVVIERFSPQVTREIAFLSDLKQIMNKSILKGGCMSIIEDKEVVEIKRTDFILEMKIAIEKTNEYLNKEKE